jgi:hypothetical protein
MPHARDVIYGSVPVDFIKTTWYGFQVDIA